jgi:excisionase family DNA binding protein
VGTGAKKRSWVRVQQAADLLGVSPSTLRRWGDSGRVECRRTPSGQRQFPTDELEGFVTARALPSNAPPAAATEPLYRLLYETSRDLASSLELDEVLQAAARRLTALLAIPDCDIYRLDDGERLVCLTSTVDGVLDTSWVGRELSVADWPCERLAVAERRPIAIGSLADPLLSAVERDEMERYGQRSCLSLPLVAREEVVGVVDLMDRVERDFDEEEITTAAAVGQLVGQALAHAELYEEVKRLHLGNLRALSTALSA